MEEKHYDGISVISLVASEKKRGKFIANLSDDSEILVSASQIADFDLYDGREFSSEEYFEMIFDLKFAQAKSRALKILGNRNFSTSEIKNRLIGKGESEEIAQLVTDWLLELGLINDEQFARSILSHYCSKGYGPLRLKDEMFKRGIPRDLQSEVLAELDEDQIQTAAQAYLKKKLKDLNAEPGDLRNAANALYKRGFSYEQADSAVRIYEEKLAERD